MSDTRPSRIDLFSFILGLIVTGIAVNLAQFGAIESRSHSGYRVTKRYSNPDLWHIGVRETGLVRQRYDAALALGKFAPGSTLIVPSNARDSRGTGYPRREFLAQMVTVGRVASLQRLDYDPKTLLKTLKPGKYVVAQSPKGRRNKSWSRRFLLLAKDAKKKAKGSKGRGTTAKEFILVSRGSTDFIVDTKLAGKRLEALRQ